MFRVWDVFYDHFSMEVVGQCLLEVGSVSGWAELSFPMLTAAFWSVTGDLKVLCSEMWMFVSDCARGKLGTGRDRQRQAATHSLCPVLQEPSLKCP